MTRRILLTDFGAAGLGVVILGACGGSSDGAATPSAATESSPNTEPPGTGTPTTGTPVAPTTEPQATGAPAADEASGSTLQLQHVSLGFVSAYVLLRGDEAAVVDTGTSGSAGAIFDGLSALGASWSNVGHVVLTHNHGDHAGGLAGVLEEAPGAIVYAGDADLGQIQTSAPTLAIGDGDEVLGLGVFNTPGHTAGSISLFDTATGILVAGDAINGDDGRLTGANARFSTDLALASESIAKLAALEPQLAAFGHGGAPISTDVTAQLQALAAEG